MRFRAPLNPKAPSRFNLFSLALLACFPLVSFDRALAQSPSLSPPPLYSFALAYDDDRQRLVLFGGFFNGAYFGDTWEWDGADWARVSQTGPSPRNAPAMAYDYHRQKTVLFGGDVRNRAFGDTWEWDGNEWQNVASSGPPARSIHTLVYDSRRRKMVLFGGIANNVLLGDTWEWDGEQWTQVSTSGPAPRILHASAYDSVSGKVLIFGGNASLTSPQTGQLGDTWEWDGSTWRLASESGPSARDHAAMAYDAARSKTVLFGGASSDNLGDTWEWDGRSWQQASTSGIPARAGHKIVFDSSRQKVILYGGFVASGPLTELWEWDGANWTKLPLTAVSENKGYMASFQLEQNYPNPFNPSTTIHFTLATPGLVDLKVYDIQGHEVITLLHEWRPLGEHAVEFEAKDLASGIYYCRLEAEEFVAVRKMVLAR